jgi:hypothetical protein
MTAIRDSLTPAHDMELLQDEIERRNNEHEIADITVAELERLELEFETNSERMLTLEWRLGEMVALMQSDIDSQKITAGETRTKIIDECRDLLGLKGR